MARQVSINGSLVDEQDATISVFDHGLLYGDGVFEGMRSYGGKVFRMQLHIDRLYDSAKAICLPIPIGQEELAAAVNATIQANQANDGYVRLIVTRGRGNLGLDPSICTNPQVIIIADRIQLYPREFYEKGLEIVTASTIRNNPAALNPRIKSLNYLNNILAKIEGAQAGCVEALMLNHKGEVAECTGDNIFIIREGALLTPSTDAGILQGVTRDAVLELAVEAGMTVHETTLSRHDIYVAHECFLTGSAAEVVPVVKVDSRTIGTGEPGPITTDLMQRFAQLTRQAS